MRAKSFFFLNFSRGEEQVYLKKLMREVEEYLSLDYYDENLVRLLIITINDSASLGQRKALATLKDFFSSIRRRLKTGKPHEYKRLIHLLDSFIRNCGMKAQSLIGQKKFLQVISITARKFRKRPITNYQECAAIALDCIQGWAESFRDYQQTYPHYLETYQELKEKYSIQFPRAEYDLTRIPIPVDVAALEDKFPPHLYQDHESTSRPTSSSESSFIIEVEEIYDEYENEESDAINVRYSTVFEMTDSFYGEVGLAKV